MRHPEAPKRTTQVILRDHAEKNPGQLLLVTESNGTIQCEIQFRTCQDGLLMLFLLKEKLNELIKSQVQI